MYVNDFILKWRHNESDGVSNHRRLVCLLNCLFRRGSKKTSKLHVTGLCEGNSPVTGEFPPQRAGNAESFPFDYVIMTYLCFSYSDITENGWWNLAKSRVIFLVIYNYVYRDKFEFLYKVKIPQISQCACSISNNAPHRTEMSIFLNWIVYYGIWERCIVACRLIALG